MKYIPAKRHWMKMYKQYIFYETQKKFPIHKVQIKPLRNRVDKKEVLYMLMNFNKDAWMPVTLDKNSFLVDGQHRLELAKQLGLEFIDAVIYNEKKALKNKI